MSWIWKDCSCRKIWGKSEIRIYRMKEGNVKEIRYARVLYRHRGTPDAWPACVLSAFRCCLAFLALHSALTPKSSSSRRFNDTPRLLRSKQLGVDPTVLLRFCSESCCLLDFSDSQTSSEREQILHNHLPKIVIWYQSYFRYWNYTTINYEKHVCVIFIRKLPVLLFKKLPASKSGFVSLMILTRSSRRGLFRDLFRGESKMWKVTRYVQKREGWGGGIRV